LGKWDLIEETWRDIVKRCLKRELGYDNLTAREGLYYIGIALQRRDEQEMAIKYLKKCIDVSEYVDGDKETGFYSSTLLKLGISYKKLNDKKKALYYFKKVLDVDDYQNNHETAKSQIENINK